MKKSIGLLIIGDEILSGKRQDQHMGKAIELLRMRGLELSWAEYLADDPGQITSALKRTMQLDAIVFSFGGIGATPDDFTRQSAADALGVPLIRHPEAVAEIEARFGADAYPKRVLMAEFPEGSSIIPNLFNRIAAFSVEHHHFLPGFPEMAWPMMEWVLDRKYAALFHQTSSREEIIVIENAVESDLLDLMNQIVQTYAHIKLSSLPQFKGDGRIIELSIRGKPDEVSLAMSEVKKEIQHLGFRFIEKS